MFINRKDDETMVAAARASFEANPEIRAEFGEPAIYIAYLRAVRNGQVEVRDANDRALAPLSV